MKAGDRVLSYIVDRELGEGGMGTVYLARHTALDQFVAIKSLSLMLSRDEALRARFLQEANIQAKLRHPGIVQVLTADMESEQPSLVMEYIEGKSLSEVLELRGALPIDDALKIMEQVLSAVGYAHRQGVIHRDLKPSNVMVMASGEAKVTDFGIAKVLGSSKLTRTGTAMGSAHYMSPEQIRRPETVDARSDIYSLGCVFYEVLTGRPPFGEKDTSGTESDYEVKTAHVTETAPALETVKIGIPAWLAKLVMSMLEKGPDQRPSSCEVIAEKLKAGDNLEQVQGDKARRTSEQEKTAGAQKEDQKNSQKDKSADKAFNQGTLIIVVAIIAVASIFVFKEDKKSSEQQDPGLFESPAQAPSVEPEPDVITRQIEQMALKIEAGNPNKLALCTNDQNTRYDNCWGTYTWPNGEKYVGEFRDEKRIGQGMYTWPSGTKYVGEFKDNNFNGRGTKIWADGENYDGEFKDDKFNGQGTYTWSNGDKYVGEFKDYKFNGHGINYAANGSVKTSGIYRNDKLIKSEYVDPNSFSRMSK